jgi:chitin disaccharide deacetylase
MPRRDGVDERDAAAVNVTCGSYEDRDVSNETPTAAPASSHLRRIWLCADDYGISNSVNAAIRDLVLQGRLNATSVMVVTPTFKRSEALSLAILNAGTQRVAIGLHLTLTAPFKPLSSGYGPLHKETFLPLKATLRAAMLRMLRPEKIAVEVAAQIKAFETAFGRLPDFVDGHQHVHLFPQIRDAVLNVIKDQTPHAWVRQCGRLPAKARAGDRKAWLLDQFSRTFRKRAKKLGIRVNPAFAGTYDFDAKPDFATLFPTFLEGLPDGSVVMCHPGHVDEELQRLDPLTTLREVEYRYLAEDAFPGVLAAKGITLAVT